MNFSKNGIPIVSVEQKVRYLQACLEEGANEDALGHLFDLLNHVAPGYKYLDLKNIQQLAGYYGKNPTPIAPNTGES